MFKNLLKLFPLMMLMAPEGGAGGGGDPAPAPSADPTPETFDPAQRIIKDDDGCGQPPAKVAAKYVTQLAKEHQGDDFTGIETLDALYTGYKDLREKSKNALHIPTAESTDDEIKAFFTKIGMPDTKEGYGLKDYDFNPEEIKTSKDRFAEMAHKCGLTKAQAAALWKHELAEYADIKASVVASYEKAKQDYEPKYDSVLKEEYPDESKRKERRKLEDNLIKDFAAKTGMGEAFTNTLLGIDPATVHKLASWYERIDPTFVDKGHKKSIQDELAEMYPSMAGRK